MNYKFLGELHNFLLNNNNCSSDEMEILLEATKKFKVEEVKETHNKLREILKEYGSEEYGDCIVDDICKLFGFPLTECDEDEN